MATYMAKIMLVHGGGMSAAGIFSDTRGTWRRLGGAIGFDVSVVGVFKDGHLVANYLDLCVYVCV